MKDNDPKWEIPKDRMNRIAFGKIVATGSGGEVLVRPTEQTVRMLIESGQFDRLVEEGKILILATDVTPGRREGEGDGKG